MCHQWNTLDVMRNLIFIELLRIKRIKSTSQIDETARIRTFLQRPDVRKTFTRQGQLV